MKSDGKKSIVYWNDDSSRKKFITYLATLITRGDFNNEIINLRKKYKVPVDGYKDYFTSSNDPDDEMPLVILPPDIDNKRFLNDSVDLARKYGLPSDWFSIIQNLVAYDEFDFSDYDTPSITVLDGIEYESGISNPLSKIKPTSLKNYVQDGPVVIFVNPYNSQRDIIDFIKKNYNEKIKPIQDKYKIKNLNIGSTRKKNELMKEIETFIDQNRNVKIKELMGIVNKKFNKGYGYTHVQKIKKKTKHT